jgi:general secretion pathway protein K
VKLNRNSSCSGVALIVVMISITVLTILAAGFAYSMKVETKLAQNANSESELSWLGRSGVERARWILGQQLAIAREPYDALNQKWAGGPGGVGTTNSALADISLDDYQLGNGSFSLKIVDLERKINVNVADQAMLEQALKVAGVDPSSITAISASILDWIDPDNMARVGGAESDYYQGLEPPYYAKNRPIDDTSELLFIRGITPEIYWGPAVTEHVPAAFQKELALQGRNFSTYPVGLVDLFTPVSSGRININTASAEVLQALTPFIDENIAAQIVQIRSEEGRPIGSPGKTILDALVGAGLPGPLAQQIGLRFFDVRSRTFQVEVDAQVAGYKRKFFAILGRASPRDVQVLSFYWK